MLRESFDVENPGLVVSTTHLEAKYPGGINGYFVGSYDIYQVDLSEDYDGFSRELSGEKHPLKAVLDGLFLKGVKVGRFLSYMSVWSF